MVDREVKVPRIAVGVEKRIEERTGDWPDYVAGPQSAVDECTRWLCVVLAAPSA